MRCQLRLVVDTGGDVPQRDPTQPTAFSASFHMCWPADLQPAAVRLLPGGNVTGPATIHPTDDDASSVQWPLQTIGVSTGSATGALCVRPQHTARLSEPHEHPSGVRVTMELTEANAGLTAAALDEPGAVWTNAVLWDGEVLYTWEHEGDDAIAARSLAEAHVAELWLGQPDDANHTLEVLLDSRRYLEPEMDELAAPLHPSNNRASLQVRAYVLF